MRSRTELILTLAPEELEQTIVAPAQRKGIHVEPELVTQIAADVSEQPGTLPLLEYALTELFERREGPLLTLDAYRAIGGVVGALTRRADDLYQKLDPDGQAITRQLFLRLITLGEGVEDTRRRVPKQELLTLARQPQQVEAVLDSFARYRLLTLDQDPATGAPTVELAHEALLRAWGQLRTWISQSRDDLRLHRRLLAAATEWTNTGRETSFLASGTRLEQFEAWRRTTDLALNQEERDYLDASLAERERQTMAEQKRQAREKAIERRSRTFLWALVGVFLTAALVGFGLAVVAINQSQIAQQNAVIAARNAAESQNMALVAGSQAALASGNTDLAIALSLRAATLDPTSASAQVALGQAAYAPGTIRRFVGHTDSVEMAAFSPDGRTIISGSLDKTLILWDVQTGHIIRRFEGHTGGVFGVAFSPDGLTILSGSADKTLILWDVQTGHIIRRFEGHSGGVTSLAMSQDGRTALSGSEDKTLILWDVQTGHIIRRFEGHTVQVDTIVFSPDGQTALSGSWDKTLILWDIQTGHIMQRFGAKGEGHNGPVTSVVFSPDGHTALSGGQEDLLILWDVTTGAVIRRIETDHDWTESVAFSPDGRTVLCGGGDGTLVQRDANTGQVIQRLLRHDPALYGGVLHVVFSRDGRTVLTSAADHTLRLWDLNEGQILRRFAGHQAKAWAADARFSPDGRTALSGGRDGRAILWDVQTGQVLHELTVAGDVFSTTFSADGRTALITTGGLADLPGDVIVWNLATGQEIRRLKGHPSGVIYAVFSPDGRTVLSGGMKGYMILWDLTTGQEIRRLRGYENDSPLLQDSSSCGSFSPDGRTVMTGFGKGLMVLWDVATGQEIRRFVGHIQFVNSTIFSSDGRTVLSGSWDKTVILWDVATGTILNRLADSNTSIFKVALSPDEHLAFAGSADGTSILWDLKTGQVIRRYTGRNAKAYSAGFSPDGHSIFLGFYNGEVQLWRIDSQAELTAWTYANRYVPELDCKQRKLYQLEPTCDAKAFLAISTP